MRPSGGLQADFAGLSRTNQLLLSVSPRQLLRRLRQGIKYPLEALIEDIWLGRPDQVPGERAGQRIPIPGPVTGPSVVVVVIGNMGPPHLRAAVPGVSSSLRSSTTGPTSVKDGAARVRCEASKADPNRLAERICSALRTMLSRRPARPEFRYATSWIRLGLAEPLSGRTDTGARQSGQSRMTFPDCPERITWNASSNSVYANRWVMTGLTSSPLWSIDSIRYQVSYISRP